MIERLKADGASQRQWEAIESPHGIDADEAGALLGDALPPGLVLYGSEG